MGEAGEDHGHGIIRREREIGLCNMGLELVHDGGEDRVGEPIQRPPLGVAEWRLEGPDVLRGESPKRRDGEICSGG